MRTLERELESARHAARSEGFEAGLRQGREEAQAQVDPVLARLAASLGDLSSVRAGLRARAERDTVQLALLIARRILHRELAVDDNSLNAIARVAFERLAASESCTLTVHPRFAAAIAAGLPADKLSRIRIEPDPASAPGAMVFRTTDGIIDASVDSQLEEISRGLADRLGQSPQLPR